MQEKHLNTSCDFRTAMQIRQALMPYFFHSVLSYDEKMQIWAAVPIVKIQEGMSYLNLIKRGLV